MKKREEAEMTDSKTEGSSKNRFEKRRKCMNGRQGVAFHRRVGRQSERKSRPKTSLLIDTNCIHPL